RVLVVERKRTARIGRSVMRQRAQIQILASESERMLAANHVEAGPSVEDLAFERGGDFRGVGESPLGRENHRWQPDGVGAESGRKALNAGLLRQIFKSHYGRSNFRVGMDESAGEIEQDTGRGGPVVVQCQVVLGGILRGGDTGPVADVVL